MRSLLPLLLLASLQTIHCDIGFVQVTSNLLSNQLLYSSTLQWTPIQTGQKLPENSVMGAISSEADNNVAESQGKAFVCRLKNEGMWLLGQVRTTGKNAGICVGSMHRQLYPKSEFDILENVDDGGRLSWVRWDKYSSVPAGTVTGDSMSYIARRSSPNSADGYSYQLGKLDPIGLGHLSVITDDGVQDFEDGEVLVETEPLRYLMKRVKFNNWRKRVHKTPQVLGIAKMTNEDDHTQGESRVDTVIGYE